MHNKLTIEEVRKVFEGAGFKLLTEDYFRNTQRLEIRCPDYHTTTTTWAQIKKSGVRCAECCRSKWNRSSVQEHLDINYKGYNVLAVCSDSRTTVSIKCPSNHVNIIRWTGFLKNENKCETCKTETAMQNRTLLFEDEIRKSGYKIIRHTGNQGDWKRRAIVQCVKSHKPYEVRVENFISGKRCRHCRDEKIKNLLTHSYNYVKSYIEVESNSGYKLLSEEYVNSDTHIEVMCVAGHAYKVRFDNFQTGYRCKECHLKYNRGENHSSWQGGISELNNKLRCLLGDWKRLSLESNDYTCDVTGIRGGMLEVHHKYSFHCIVNDILTDLNIDKRRYVGSYTVSEMKAIESEFNKAHLKLLGVPLTVEVHSFYHGLFGRFNNTENQYLFFKKNYEKLKSGIVSANDFSEKEVY